MQPSVTASRAAVGGSALTGEEAGLRRELRRAVAGRRVPGSLSLLVECRRDSGFAALRVFGDGIAIWNDERQFRLDGEQIAGLLRALQEADFPALEDTYGGPRPRPRESEMATIVTCRIELALEGFVKRALQMDKGEQSPVLKELAEELLAACEAPALSGVTADGLRDGLEKIARGELAPETWVIVAHLKPEDPAREAGFLLRVLGAEVSVQAYDARTGYREPALRRLGQEEIRRLAAELAARDPSSWPVNLYAQDYTDLSFQVLNRGKSIQARRFAGMEPGTGGPPQRAFEEVWALLEALHHSVLNPGETP
jgi:hypothetical protein